MAGLDGFLWFLVETQETRMQPDLPDIYHLEIPATSQEVAAIEETVGDTPGPRGAVTAPVKTCLTPAMDGGVILCF